jgi:hypothetical protein
MILQEGKAVFVKNNQHKKKLSVHTGRVMLK